MIDYLFAAGDVGGARALLPVARLAAARGGAVTAMAHGTFLAEGETGWNWVTPDVLRDPAWWAGNRPDVCLYATSVFDPNAVKVAAIARGRDIPIVHVLDNWSSYGARLAAGDAGLLFPDVYAVLDPLSEAAAAAEGVPRETLLLAGHPNLAGLGAERERLGAARQSGPLDLLFVSEPARADHGAAGDPASRGYDEQWVTELAITALAALAPPRGLQVHVAPHPREDAAEVEARWAALAPASLAWNLLPRDAVRRALHRANGLIGMTSLLLYEGWLLGKPVASLQPNLRIPALRSLEARAGVRFCTAAGDVAPMLASLIVEAQAPAAAARPDLAQHIAAASIILDAADRLVTSTSGKMADS